MSATAELDDLLGRLVDDRLDDTGTVRLQDILRADATARRRYRQVMALHANLQWDYVAAARGESPVQSSRSRRSPWLIPMVLAATLLISFLAPWSWWMYRYGADSSLTVSSINDGTLIWVDHDTPYDLQVGERRPAGLYHLRGEGATAVLNFSDGTNLTLIGDTVLNLPRTIGKWLHLEQGSLTADVRPQQVETPLVIETATSRIQVIGTRFSVHAEEKQTSLEVDQGRVRIERLIDGQETELTDGQQTSVSFEAGKPIAVTTRPQIPHTWRSDFAQRPPAHWSGAWTAPADGGVGFLTSTPYVAGRDANGRPLIHHGVRIENAQAANRPFVRLHNDSRLTMRFRMMRGDSRTQVKVMLCMKRDNGSFGGTFFASLDPQSLPADAEGWRTAVLAMPAFVPTRPTIHPSPVGNNVTFILANTAARPAGLEVASLAIDQP